jgi:hypothetical protein
MFANAYAEAPMHVLLGAANAKDGEVLRNNPEAFAAFVTMSRREIHRRVMATLAFVTPTPHAGGNDA